jgi:large subunit ribosomal protein L22
MAVASPDRVKIAARARHVRTSAQKARLVLEHIRGKPAEEARAILQFQTRAAARDAGKVLASAIANAENNAGYDPDDLIVVGAYADEGPTIKRWRARARGRVNRIRKQTCHITIELAVAEPGEMTRRQAERAARPKRRAAQPKQAQQTAPEVAEEAAPEAPAEEAAPEPVEEAQAEEPVAEERAAEAAPKRKPRARRTAKPRPEAAPAGEPAAAAGAGSDTEPSQNDTPADAVPGTADEPSQNDTAADEEAD